MKNKGKRNGFTPQEHLVSILPSIVIGITLLFTSIVLAVVSFSLPHPFQKVWLILFSILGVLHLAFYYIIYNSFQRKLLHVWVNISFAVALFCALSYFLPAEIKHLIYIMVFLSALPASLLAGRGPTYVLLFGVTTFHYILNLSSGLPPHELITHIGFTVTAFIGLETIQQLRNIAALRIKRLEIINELSRQIASTLETKQIFALLDAAIQNALGGLPFLAPFHTLTAWLFATFIIGHVYLTTTAGPKPLDGIQAMVTGWEDMEVHKASNQ